jgi:hypothetical protein
MDLQPSKQKFNELKDLRQSISDLKEQFEHE